MGMFLPDTLLSGMVPDGRSISASKKDVQRLKGELIVIHFSIGNTLQFIGKHAG
jgi:hypothetical protein